MNRLRRWFVMIILCLSGGIIFMLPFLREVYYIPMQEAFGYSNTQLGVLSSVFGTISLLTYFPGGWLADRFSPRKLIASSLLATGLAGLYFATYPSYNISILIHGFWGASISLVFWCAMIKAAREWASADQQGKAFGILESGRGVTEVFSSTLFLAVFAWLGSGATALSQVINLFALTNIALGIMAWFILDNHHGHLEVDSKDKAGLKEIIVVLKMPEVWLISIVVLTAYCAYSGSYYFAPYSTDVYALSVVMGGAVAVGKMWLKPFAAIGAGFIADKVGVSLTVVAFFVVTTACFVTFGLLPGGKSYLVVMLINATIVSIAVFALRGIYFALLEEGGVAPAVTGTAVGIVSAIGFTPDIFIPLIAGQLLDNYPGAQGYQYFFLVIAVFCAIGTAAAYLLLRKSRQLSLAADNS